MSCFSCQSQTEASSPNKRCTLLRADVCFCWIPVQVLSAAAFTTFLWHYVYLPSPRALGQQQHSGYAGVSKRPQQWSSDGLGSTSYTAWNRKLESCLVPKVYPGDLQGRCCWHMATVLLPRSSLHFCMDFALDNRSFSLP